MEKIRKEFIGEHYLSKDVVVVCDKETGLLTITSYNKNTGRRRFEMVELNKIQATGLKDMLNENL